MLGFDAGGVRCWEIEESGLIKVTLECCGRKKTAGAFPPVTSNYSKDVCPDVEGGMLTTRIYTGD